MVHVFWNRHFVGYVVAVCAEVALKASQIVQRLVSFFHKRKCHLGSSLFGCSWVSVRIVVSKEDIGYQVLSVGCF